MKNMQKQILGWIKNAFKQKKSIIVTLFLFALLSTIYLRYTWISSISATEEQALKIAKTVEVSLNGETLKNLKVKREDEDTAAYESIKKRLINVVNLYKNIRFVYIYTEKEDKIYIMADSEPIESADYSPPGQEYTEANIELKDAFADGKAFITKPVTDRWGKWISILVPMRNDKTGAFYAVLGMDYPAGAWLKEAERNTLYAGEIILAILLLILAYGIIMTKNSELKEEQKKIVLANTMIRNSEKDLYESEAKYRILIENSYDIIYRLTTDGIFAFVSPSWKVLLGYKEEDVIGLSYTQFIHPDDLHICMASFIAVKETGQRQENIEYRVRHADGTWYWHSSSASPLTDESGIAIGFVGTARDITERKKMEKALRQSEERYKSVSAVSNTGAWEYNRELDYVWCSPEYFTMLGYDPEDFKKVEGNLKEVWVDLLHPDEQEADIAAFKNYISGALKGMYDNHLRMRRKNGEWSWIWSRGKTLRDENGELTNLTVGTHIDVTLIKKIEQALYTEKEQFKTTLLSVGDGVISTDTQGNVMIFNEIAEQLTGWSQAEAFGKPLKEVFNIINEFSRESCENPVYKVLETGEVFKLANYTILISKDGSERPIEDSAAPIKDEQGNINGVVLVFRDFTEKKEKQDRIFYLSFYDQLTELYNRRFFEEELKRLDTERNLPLTLVLLDVNGLKLTNDAFGHLVGDKVLKKVAEVIKNECRTDDIIARIGGDEFVILLPKTDSSQTETIIKRIHDVIANEKVDSINLSVSFGWETKQEIEEEMMKVFKKAEDHMYRHKLSESSSMRYKTITVILKTLYEKNKREEHHSKRVSQLCVKIGSALNLSQVNIRELKIVGLMHDIGKIAINDVILNKVSPLNDSEWLEIKRHPEIGYNILRSVNEYAQLAEYVLAHHERWDGTGYPKGLKGKEIPLLARIISIVDAYDAMTGYRTYRKALSRDEAIKEIKRNAGTQFDPEIVKQAFDEIGIKNYFRIN